MIPAQALDHRCVPPWSHLVTPLDVFPEMAEWSARCIVEDGFALEIRNIRRETDPRIRQDIEHAAKQQWQVIRIEILQAAIHQYLGKLTPESLWRVQKLDHVFAKICDVGSGVRVAGDADQRARKIYTEHLPSSHREKTGHQAVATTQVEHGIARLEFKDWRRLRPPRHGVPNPERVRRRGF